jgi:hypothetical protein
VVGEVFFGGVPDSGSELVLEDVVAAPCFRRGSQLQATFQPTTRGGGRHATLSGSLSFSQIELSGVIRSAITGASKFITLVMFFSVSS